MKIPFNVLRVFVSDNGRYGNPVGVIIDDNNKLTPGSRQKIAQKIGYSESVFINNPNTGNISIFNPIKEVDFAGHAVLGTAYFITRTINNSLPSLECKTGKVEFWQEGNLMWIHADLKGTPPWHLEQLQSPKSVETLSVSEMAHKEHTMVWAWIDECNNIIRARTFAPDWGIPEDQGNGSGSMQLAALLGKRLEIHHGKGSMIYAKPAGDGYADVGGLVVKDEDQRVEI